MHVRGRAARASQGSRLARWWRAVTRRRSPIISIYSDGSSHGEAGRSGGWAFAVVQDGTCLLEGSGADAATTNNVMELQAALAGLMAVIARGWHLDTTVELVSDSRLALDVARGAHLPTVDFALAQTLRAACEQAGARTRWVRGHSGDVWNDRVDVLAHDAKQTLVPDKVKKKAERRQRRSPSRALR